MTKLDISETYKKLHKEILALRREEHAALIKLSVLLGDFDKERFYRDAGYSSLFTFLVEGLNYSKPAAARRMRAARCVREFPMALALLEEHKVSLTTLALVSGELTQENHLELLREISGKSSTEVEKVLVRRRPAPRVKKERIKPVGIAKKQTPTGELALFSKKPEASPEPSGTRGTPAYQGEQLGEVRYEMSFSANPELFKKFQEAKGLLGVGVSIERVFEAALDAFLEKKSPKRRNARRRSKAAPGKSAKGQQAEAKPTAKRVTARVRDLVLERDGYRCTWEVLGRRCSATIGLEIDHIKPQAKGGGHDSENLRCLCAAHNRLAAEKSLGREFMQKFY